VADLFAASGRDPRSLGVGGVVQGRPARMGAKGNGPANPVSKDSPRPPNKSAFERDFGRLTPGSVARHSPKADPRTNEHVPMTETGVEFQPGSYPHKMGAPREPTGSKAKTIRAAGYERLARSTARRAPKGGG
jgi:hypothetical protein